MRTYRLGVAVVAALSMCMGSAIAMPRSAKPAPRVHYDRKAKTVTIKGKTYGIQQVNAMLSEVADYVFVDDKTLQRVLAPLLRTRQGPGTVGLTKGEFEHKIATFKERAGGGLLLGFAGPVGSASDDVKKKQSKAVETLLKQTGKDNGGAVVGTVHGGTLVDGFLRTAHEVGRDLGTRQVSIGILPEGGLPDLLEQLANGYRPERKMTSLAIIGKDYEDDRYTRFMAETLDVQVTLGGNEGAAAEASAARAANKFSLGLPIGKGQAGSKAILTATEGGLVDFTNPKVVASFIRGLCETQPFTPGSVWGKETLYNHIKDNRLVMSNFLSTSGGPHNPILADAVLNDFYRLAFPNELAGRLGFASGGTDVGVVPISHKLMKDHRVFNASIFAEPGLEYPHAPVHKAVLHGTQWGGDSEVTVGTAAHVVAYGGGGQAMREIEAFLDAGDTKSGPLHNFGWDRGHVIALYDPRAMELAKQGRIKEAEEIGGTTFKLLHSGVKRDRLHYFPADQKGIEAAATLHQELMRETAKAIDHVSQ